MTAKIENDLRNEYIQLKPSLLKIHRLLEAQIGWYLKDLIYTLENYQRIEVKYRIKDCESAIASLKSKQQFGFDEERKYTLRNLKDLVGARILVFPSTLITEVNKEILSKFPSWNTDHDSHGGTIVWKYDGHLENQIVRSEIQIVSMLTGLFWEVEHFTLYKPHSAYRGIKKDPKMMRLYEEALNKLSEYETAFENYLNTTEKQP